MDSLLTPSFPKPQPQTHLAMWNNNNNNNNNNEDDDNDDDSWEVRAFEEDTTGNLLGCTWPPRSYTCAFCRREFRSAQALGGHMNVHRRDRARLHHPPPPSPPPPPPSQPPILVANGLCLLYPLPNPNSIIFPNPSPIDFPSPPLHSAETTPNSVVSSPSASNSHDEEELDLELRLGRRPPPPPPPP